MKQKLDIVVLMDAACIPEDDRDFMLEEPEPTTEHHVVNALRGLGHAVRILGADHNVGEIVAALTGSRPDLVFNLTEVFRGNRRHDANIAALLEMLDIPFTGTGSTGLMLCRGKDLCKQLLSLHKIRVPGFVTLAPGRRTRVPRALRFPMVVKPAYTDGSEGIAKASLVNNLEELQQRTRLVHERWQQAALAEEYINGRELYVSIMGNNRLTVLPPREIFLPRETEGPALATYRVKWDYAYRDKWNIRFGPAQLEPDVMAGITRTCKKVFRILQLKDYARIDVRLTPEDRMFILEVNPNPDIAYGDEVAESAEKAGIGYHALIDRIIRLAMRRYQGRHK